MFSNKALKKLILPLIIEQILIMAVGVADTVMVSYAGEVAISGVGLVDMFNNLIITVLAAIDAGGAIIVSQYIGNKDRKNANKASSQLLTITIVIATVIMLGCLVFHRILLSTFFGAIEMDVMKAATTYFLISAISFPFLGVYNSAAALYRSMEKTRTTMYVSILMNIINVVGNYIGVFILHAGVAGVAVPTLISRIVAAIIMFALSLNSSNLVYVKIKNVFAWNQEMISRILKIAVPNGIENGLFTLGRLLVTSIVALFGTSQISSNSVAVSIDQIEVVVVNAINLGIVVVVGQCIGANDYEQAKYYIKKLMKISYIVTGIIGSAVILLLPWILNLYSLSSEARNLTFILVIMHNIMATALHPTAFVLPNGLRAAGDVKFSMVVGIVSMILFRLGAAVLFGIIFNLGIIGVWIAMGSDWLCRSVCFVIRFIKGKWRQFKVI